MKRLQIRHKLGLLLQLNQQRYQNLKSNIPLEEGTMYILPDSARRKKIKTKILKKRIRIGEDFQAHVPQRRKRFRFNLSEYKKKRKKIGGERVTF